MRAAFFRDMPGVGGIISLRREQRDTQQIKGGGDEKALCRAWYWMHMGIGKYVGFIIYQHQRNCHNLAYSAIPTGVFSANCLEP